MLMRERRAEAGPFAIDEEADAGCSWVCQPRAEVGA